jgi:hypothetical protein
MIVLFARLFYVNELRVTAMASVICSIVALMEMWEVVWPKLILDPHFVMPAGGDNDMKK